jgi:hypothetical protein
MNHKYSIDSVYQPRKHKRPRNQPIFWEIPKTDYHRPRILRCHYDPPRDTCQYCGKQNQLYTDSFDILIVLISIAAMLAYYIFFVGQDGNSW